MVKLGVSCHWFLWFLWNAVFVTLGFFLFLPLTWPRLVVSIRLSFVQLISFFSCGALQCRHIASDKKHAQLNYVKLEF